MNKFNRLKGRIEFWFFEIFSFFKRSVVVEHEGCQFELKTSTSHEVHRALTFASKEPETLRWIDGFREFGDGVVIFDVGANIGIYSLYAAAKYPNARILAFEPDSQSFSSLCLNVSVNNFNIAPYSFAISDKSGIDLLHVSILLPGAGASALGENYTFINKESGKTFKQGVFHTSLDDLVYEQGMPIPNYIKIDVDGIEHKILEGATRVLKSNDCVGVLVEVQYKNQSDIDAVCNHLESHGFYLKEKSLWIAELGSMKSQNFIFSK